MTQVLDRDQRAASPVRTKPTDIATTAGQIAGTTTWLTLCAWSGFTVDPIRYLFPCFAIGLAILLTRVFARRLRASRLLTVLAQTCVALLGIFVSVTGSPLPSFAGLEALAEAFVQAITTAQSYTSPIPRTPPSVHPLLIASGALTLLLADVLASSVKRASLVGLPILVIYLVPAAMNGTPVSWWVFPVSAAGFLLLLYVSEFHLASRWGRQLERTRRGPVGNPSPLKSFDSSAATRHRQHALSIGLPAIALAILVALSAPSWDLSGWGPGSGTGGGGDEITIQSPMTDLRRDLTRGRDVPWLRIETSDPSPGYLRIAVLNRFSNNAWTSGNRNFPSDQTAQGQDLPLTGTAPQVQRTEHSYDIRAAAAFDSTWLPVPFPVTAVSAKGVWKYDRDTIDFLAAEDELTTADLSYSARAVDLEYDAEMLAAAAPGAGAVPSIFTRLPKDFPEFVQDLSDEVTKSSPSDFEKAVALQDWFRDTGGFEYSLNTAPGTGSDELVAFLTRGNGGRVGYCEQFASAMAVMARAQGIPARVAVGFLRPDRIGPNQWEYSSHDLHAWPELYFPGAGWVRFEPTPSARAEGVPDYTTQDLARPEPEPSDSAAPSPSSSSSSGAPRADGPNLPDEQTFESSAQSSSWPRVVAVLGGVTLLLVTLLIPRGIRTVRRTRRWQGATELSGPELAWAELRDSVSDLGRRWPLGLSPRETHGRLAQWFGRPLSDNARQPWGEARWGNAVNPDAVAALDRIVLALEEVRYSAISVRSDVAQLRADVECCTSALGTGVSPAARRRALWWPISAFRRSEREGVRQPSIENEEILG